MTAYFRILYNEIKSLEMAVAASTSETSLNFSLTTLRNNPEDSHLYTHLPENLTSH
jgi:hypothetical protein